MHMYDIPTYYPHTAQKKYLLRRSYCHRGMFHSQEVIDYINEKLKATWSPEQADTIASGHGKSKACFAALAERKTGYYIAVKIPNRRAETMENAIVSVLSAFPPQLVKTITCDRGTEFANWRNMEERLHCDAYFTDPYCAWQKGTNENLNGIL